MSGQARWRALGLATLVAVAVSGCGSGSRSPSAISPVVGEGSSAAAGGSPSGTGDAAASGTPRAPRTSAPATSAATSGSAAGTVSALGSVKGYYSALGAHDAAAAARYLSPEYLATFGDATGFGAWAANFLSITQVAVQPAKTPGDDEVRQHPTYRDLTLVPVTYTAHLRTPSANEVDGPLDRFVLVGRSTGGAWLVVDIATSP
jgi:hypothetical protein